VRLVAACLVLLPFAVTAETISGPARAVDGDTLVIQGVRVRLQNAHAPAVNQPGGAEATAALRALVVEQLVTCHAKARDRYARIVARCSVGERDVGHTMVAAGLASRSAARR